jgi:hypothetical protein
MLALGAIAFIAPVFSGGRFSSLSDAVMSSPIELAVEVKPPRNEPNSKYGNVTITSLSKETGTIKHVSINRSSQAACSFDPKEASYQTPVLTPGLSVIVATVAVQAGLCGSTFIVTVDTDKGSRDYEINWR